MDAHGGWKLEADSGSVDYRVYLKETDVFQCQFFRNRPQRNVLGHQSNPLARGVLRGWDTAPLH